MIWTLVRKELLAHLRTLRLVVALVFTVVLCALTTLMGSLDFSVSSGAYERARQERRDDLDQARIYPQLQPDVLVAPQPLTVLSRGAVEGSALSFSTSVEAYWMSTSLVGSASYDDLMLILVRADFTTAVALVLSFLAVVLGFDAVCGEREQGTLKLLLSNPVSRGQVIAAKLAGGALALWLPLALAFAVSLLILLTNPDVALGGDDWVRLGLIFALSCLVLFEVFALSVLVSTCTRSPATSLILCLFAWLVSGVGYANALPALTRYGMRYPPFYQYQEQSREADTRMGHDYEEWEVRHPGPGPAYTRGHRVDQVLRYARPEGYAWMAQQARFDFDRRLERADEDFRLRWPNQRPLAEQEWAVDEWSILSPLTNYRTLCKWAARSTLDDRFEVARYGLDYRRGWLQWMHSRLEAEGWRRWYTDDPPDQEPMIADPESVTEAMLAEGSPFMLERMRWVQGQEERAAADPRRRLDLTGMPQPDPEAARRTLGESLQQMVAGLAVMLSTLALAVVLTVRRFARYALN